MMATRRHARPPAISLWQASLFVVLLAALALRLYGIDWDDGADLHPDELFIAKIVLIDRIHLDWPPDFATLLDPARSGLNPRSADPSTGQYREFAYGALPLWITDAVGWLLSGFTNTNWNSPDRAYLLGRALSALLSALTILPIAALGAAVAGRSVGLIAALFAALAPMSIQLAHFFTTDSWLTFFVALCLLASVKAAQRSAASRFAIAGAFFGLAMASKGSVFALAAPIAAALAFDLARRIGVVPLATATMAAIRNAASAGAAALVAFLVFEPYALLRPDVYLQSLKTQANIASGAFDVPFTRVYVGTIPILYQGEQFVRWGYGPAAGVLALGGLAILASNAWRQRSAAAIVLITWVITYGAVISVSEVKFLRYMEPLAPVFAVAAAIALVRLAARARRALPVIPPRLVPAAGLVLAVLWTAAFMTIYAHENSRLTATHWIYGAIPPGSTLTAEYWDDALPRGLSASFAPASFGFGTITLDLYRDMPPPEASETLFADLRDADVIIQSSERVESAIRAAPWRYPVQGRFFDQLAKGTLGYTETATFSRPPTIGSLTFDDRGADEAFINYDHPRVTVYQRKQPISRADYDAVMSWSLQRPWSPTREAPESTLLLGQPVGENPSVADARWSAELTSSWPAAVAVWFVLLGVLLAVGRPIARLLLPGFPDQGWGLARTFALAIAAYPVWLGASLQLFRFRAIWVIAAIFVLGIAAWALNRRMDGHPTRWRSSATRLWLHAELAFWLVFALFLAFRLITPDSWHPIWGGEKPMEFAQINAIGRSAYFPPYDPWYADGYINYYYYGFYLVAFLLKATGIPLEIGFNLALPAVMAMLASGAFSVGAALARGLTRSIRFAPIGGWAGAIALSVLGNLSALQGLAGGLSAQVDPFIYWTWSGSRSIDDAITEFPYFSGLYADLHAHVVALPLTVAVIALCFSLASRPIALGARSGAFVDLSKARTVAQLATIALLIGTLSATNAWDVPVYAALTVASIVMATAGLASWSHRLIVFVVASGLTLLLAYLLFLPFHTHFVALFSQLAFVRDPTDLIQFLSHLGGLLAVCTLGLTLLLVRHDRRSIAFTPWPWVTALLALLSVISLSLSSSDLGLTAGRLLLILVLAAPPVSAAWLLNGRTANQSPIAASLCQAVLVIASAGSAASIAVGREVFGLLLPLAAAAGVGWLRIGRRAERFVCLLLAAAFCTAAGVEIIVVADDLIATPAYRMNTVFKFYNQIWVLLALSAAALVGLMVRDALAFNRRRIAAPLWRVPHLTWARLGVSIATLVLLASLTYPALATGPRLAQRFTPGTPSGTLDAFSWMEQGTVPSFGMGESAEIAFAGDAAAIDWLNEHVPGSPVIAEASIGPYRCNGSRFSSATGLPTIIGWERHEQQQRFPDTLPKRVDDVRRLYLSPDPAEKEAILRLYNVEYVVVGDLERLYPLADNDCTPSGSEAGIAAFAEMVGSTLEISFASGDTTVYRVLPIDAA